MQTSTLLSLLLIIVLSSAACKNNSASPATKISANAGNNMVDSAAFEQAAADRLIAQTFDTLRHALQTQMAKGGPAEAIEFCQVQAYPITNIYANNDTLIRRTALRYRNPANQPDTLERRILLDFESTIAEGKTAVPKLIRRADSIHYFKPIRLQAMCSTCHGDPQTEMAAKTLYTIQMKYPNDQAVGFRENDLRGIWHIKWLRK